jgi:dTDP-4-dehydrorhamnose reductase
MAERRICIIGAKGMLGRQLVRACPGAATFDLPEFDITNSDHVNTILSEHAPEILINAAAYTNVDGCETEFELAHAVNAQGVANLATACRAIQARMLHVSTDYVFNGRGNRPYQPDDAIDPINQYGVSKAAGEARLRKILPNHAIVRTSWLFSVFGQNFVKTILKLGSERDVIRVVTDQVGCPTHARELAEVLLALAATSHVGTYHFCNAGHCSRYEFASEIVRQAGLATRVEPTTSEEFERPAARPAYSMLETSALTQVIGVTPRSWQDALAECLVEMGSANRA